MNSLSCYPNIHLIEDALRAFVQLEEQPGFVKLCQTLLQDRSQDSYRLAKTALKASLESDPDNAAIQTMLVYIKIFLPNKRSAKLFLDAIACAKQRGDCFTVIEIKEAFLEYVLNESSSAEEVEMGLRQQVLFMDDLQFMGLVYDGLEELIERQNERYFLLLLKYFGGAQDPGTDLEVTVKTTLMAVTDQQDLAMFHLAHLLKMKECLKTCDVRESISLMNHLVKKLDKQSPYFSLAKLAISTLNTGTTKKIFLASLVNTVNDQELKAKVYYLLGCSYLQNDKDFDVENAYLYFKNALETAGPSSCLIPEIRYQLGCLSFLQNNLTDCEFYISEIKFDRLNVSYISKINFLNNRERKNQNLNYGVFWGFQARSSNNIRSILTILNDFRSRSIKSDDLPHFQQKEKEFLSSLFKETKKIGDDKFADRLHQLFLEFKGGDKFSTCCLYVNKIIDNKISGQSLSKIKEINIKLGVIDRLIKLTALEESLSKFDKITSFYHLLSNAVENHYDIKSKNKTQNDLIFLINQYKLLSIYERLYGDFYFTIDLFHCYHDLSNFFRDDEKQKVNLLTEAGRLSISFLSNEISEKYNWDQRRSRLFYSILAFNLSKDEGKYYTLGSDILKFGPKLVIEGCEIYKKIPNQPISADLFMLFSISVNLLRFHHREEEANDLIHLMNSFPGLNLLLSSFKKLGAKDHDPSRRGEARFILESTQKSSFSYKNYPLLKQQMKTAEGVEWIPPFDVEFNVVQERKKKKKIKMEKPPSLPPTTEVLPEPSFAKEEPSTTAVAKRNARKLLERQEKKTLIKQNRAPKCIVPLDVLAPVPPSQKACPIKIELSPTCTEIFNKLWVPNSGALNKSNIGPFDPCDYRNDIAISRLEVKTLIEELGGQYHEDGGKGSHKIGEIPSLYNSPKIILGEEMTFADFEQSGLPSSQNITLTKSPDLKCYQIRQLQGKLIKLGYTLETVKQY